MPQNIAQPRPGQPPLCRGAAWAGTIRLQPTIAAELGCYGQESEGKMKKFVLIFAWIGFIAFFLSGCASMESRYGKIQSLDTIAAYEDFIRSYPDSPFTKEARKRFQELKEKKAYEEAETRNTKTAYEEFIDKYPNSKFAEKASERIKSEETAFIQTIRIDKIQAFQGFKKSYPDSEYLPIIKDRIEFLKAVATDEVDEYNQFITQYPNNPFVVEAKTRFPVLWLKEIGEVGVVINVGEIERWRGIFGGGHVTKTEVSQEIFKKLKKHLEREGIQGFLLDSPNDSKARDINTMLVIEYEEKPRVFVRDRSRTRRPYPITGTSTGERIESLSREIYREQAEKNLEAIVEGIFFWVPVNGLFYITIKDIITGFEYYSNVPDYSNVPELNWKVDKNKQVWAMVKALEPFKERAIPSLVVALADWGRLNEGVQEKVALALKNIAEKYDKPEIVRLLKNVRKTEKKKSEGINIDIDMDLFGDINADIWPTLRDIDKIAIREVTVPYVVQYNGLRADPVSIVGGAAEQQHIKSEFETICRAAGYNISALSQLYIIVEYSELLTVPLEDVGDRVSTILIAPGETMINPSGSDQTGKQVSVNIDIHHEQHGLIRRIKIKSMQKIKSMHEPFPHLAKLKLWPFTRKIKHFIDLLEYENPSKRRSAARILGTVYADVAESAVPSLKRLSKEDDHWRVRRAADIALQRIRKASNLNGESE